MLFPEEVKTRVRRVLPGYNVVVTKYVAYVVLGCGLLMITFAGVALGIRAFTSVGGTGMLAGFSLISCSIVGWLSAARFKREVWAVSAYMFLSVVSLIFCLALLAAGVTAVSKEHERNISGGTPRAAREAIDIVSILLSVAGAVTTSVSLGLCVIGLFYGCCRKRTGVKYVTTDPKSTGGDQGGVAYNPTAGGHLQHDPPMTVTGVDPTPQLSPPPVHSSNLDGTIAPHPDNSLGQSYDDEHDYTQSRDHYGPGKVDPTYPSAEVAIQVTSEPATLDVTDITS